MALSPEDLDRCVEVLRRFGARRVILFGSALESLAEARDLDLAVEGLEGRLFFKAGTEAEKALPVSLDLIPLDPPTPFSRYVEKRGRVLYDRAGAA